MKSPKNHFLFNMPKCLCMSTSPLCVTFNVGISSHTWFKFSTIIPIKLPVFLCMCVACVYVDFLVCRSGIAEAKESQQVERTELVAAAALEMSHMIIIHIRIVDSDFQGLAGDEYKPVWRVNSDLSNISHHIAFIPVVRKKVAFIKLQIKLLIKFHFKSIMVLICELISAKYPILLQ